MRLLVQVLAAHRAETGAVGPAEDLVRELERDGIPRPDRELEPIVDDVGALQLLVGVVVAGVVLATVDDDVDDGVLETTHARAVQASGETETEHVSPGGTIDRELGARLRGHGQVALTAQLERLELDLDLFALLLTRPQPELSQ
jgi:hypothetical protein